MTTLRCFHREVSRAFHSKRVEHRPLDIGGEGFTEEVLWKGREREIHYVVVLGYISERCRGFCVSELAKLRVRITNRRKESERELIIRKDAHDALYGTIPFIHRIVPRHPCTMAHSILDRGL
jgi:hypothetical protein